MPNPNSNPMRYPIGVRLAQRRILALDTLYHHLFSTPGRDTTTIDQLKHNLVLWLTHHSFEELPEALEYYLADPNSDLEGNLAHLPFSIHGECKYTSTHLLPSTSTPS